MAGRKAGKRTKRQNTGSDTLLAAVAYVLGLITGVVVLLVADRKDSYVRFHAVQSILFNIAAWILWFLVLFVPIPGIWIGFGVLLFVLWVVLIVKAFQGERFMLPVIGEYAEEWSRR